MSAKTPTQPKRKRGAPKKVVTKVRQNISITPTVLKKAQRLALADNRSLSAWLEILVKSKIEEATKPEGEA